MNNALKQLQPYPFEKLRMLKASTEPTTCLQPIDLSVGEPKHSAPDFVLERLSATLAKANRYPTTRGNDELRDSISRWLRNRYALPDEAVLSDRHVLPVNGTREALFAIAQCCIDRTHPKPTVIIPNPFYQIYEGAALLAGATPYYLDCVAGSNFCPDLDSIPEETWRHCQLMYLCSPGNPHGAVLEETTLVKLMDLADKHDFVIANDECYSEIYPPEASRPIGLLQAAFNSGRVDFNRCIVFHSLSKRSNLPGMRSGFVAGDAQIIENFLLYRTYHGCSMPPFVQSASCAAWSDEEHVRVNRALYQEKFDAVLAILSPFLDVTQPQAGFYLWPDLPMDDVEFARGLYQDQHVTILPGSFLSRRSETGGDPGKHHARIALVAPLEQCEEAATRIRDYVNTQQK